MTQALFRLFQFIAGFIFVVMVGNQAFSQPYTNYWVGSSGSSWDDPNNWNRDVLPVNDRALFHGTTSNEVLMPAFASCAGLSIIDDGQNVSVLTHFIGSNKSVFDINGSLFLEDDILYHNNSNIFEDLSVTVTPESADAIAVQVNGSDLTLVSTFFESNGDVCVFNAPHFNLPDSPAALNILSTSRLVVNGDLFIGGRREGSEINPGGLLNMSQDSELEVYGELVFGRYAGNNEVPAMATISESSIFGSLITVGKEGAGKVSAEDGSSISAVNLVIGEQDDSEGMMELVNSSLNVSEQLTIGNRRTTRSTFHKLVLEDSTINNDVSPGSLFMGGYAEMQMIGESHASFSTASIGSFALSKIEVGDNSTLEVADEVALGTLNSSNSIGDIHISGAGSFHGESSLIIGERGFGGVSVSDHGDATIDGNVILGKELSSYGNAGVGGPNATFYVGGTMTVGDRGGGGFFVSNGGYASVGADLTVGISNGTDNSLGIDGANSQLDVQGSITAGNGFSSNSYQAFVSIWNGGVLTADNVEIRQGGQLSLQSGTDPTQFATLSTHELSLKGGNPSAGNSGGMLSGNGLINDLSQVVNNAGTMEPANLRNSVTFGGKTRNAAIAIDGSYKQELNGTIRLEADSSRAISLSERIGGGKYYDKTDIYISGNAELGGNVEVFFAGDYQPKHGDAFNLVEHNSVSRSGTQPIEFKEVNSPTIIANGQELVATYSEKGTRLVVPQKVNLVWGQDLNGYTIYGNYQPKKVDILSPDPFGSLDADIGLGASEAFQNLVLQQVKDIFERSEIDGLVIENAAAAAGATNVYMLKDPAGGLLGKALSGIDRFNQDANGTVALFLQVEGTLAEIVEFNAEVTAHELGHVFGLRHVNPQGAGIVQNESVMDYDGFIGDNVLEKFHNGPTAVVEPPQTGDADAVTMNYTQNPTYHLNRYIDAHPDEDLMAENINAGDLDKASFLEKLSNYLLGTSRITFDGPLYDVKFTGGLGGGFEGIPMDVLAEFDEIQISELGGISFELEDGGLVALYGSTVQGAAPDVFMMGDSDLPVMNGVDEFAELWMASASDPSGFVTVANITMSSVVPEPSTTVLLGLAALGFCALRRRNCLAENS